MVELLAPAGSREALAAAVENGADAVYLAGRRFGARAYAENFDEDGIREAIRYAHLRGCAVHVAVNTAVDGAELSGLADYLRFLEDAGADAALVQDLGAARLAREVAPGLPLHASTQMTAHSLAGVQALEAIGFSRVVLAREMTLAEIRAICRESRAEIEVFAHGALCVCYSGQCLMSSMIGGRSGNRGRCAQPCRLPYALVDENGEDATGGAAGKYLLSPRDLRTIGLLPELMAAGVASLKLEGRMKRPEYVAVATAAYRGAIDRAAAGLPDGAARETDRRLAQIFNRDFTTAYLLGNPGRAMMSDRRPNHRGLLVGRVVSYDAGAKRVRVRLAESLAVGDQVDVWVKTGGRVAETVRALADGRGRDVLRADAGDEASFPLARAVRPNDRVFRVFDAALTAEARASYTGTPRRRIPVRLTVAAAAGRPFSVAAASADGARAEAASDSVCARAEKHPLTREALGKQMGRVGATAYALASIDARIEDGVMVPMRVMNETRREALARLDEARLARFAARRAETAARVSVPQRAAAANISWRDRDALPKLIVHADTVERARAAVEAGADGVLYGGDAFDHHAVAPDEYRAAWALLRAAGKIVSLATPRILRDGFLPAVAPLLRALADASADEVYVHHLGALRTVREYTALPVQSDFSLLAYNAQAVRELADIGFSRATLSPELNFSQIEAIAAGSALPLECIVHGRLELMVSAYCALGSFAGNADGGRCPAPCARGRYFLRDRTGALFPVVMDAGCQMHVLNAKPLSLLPHARRFARLGIDRLRIDGRYMTAREIGETVRAYREVLLYGGELSGAQKERARRVEGGDITRGHYFRGVL